MIKEIKNLNFHINYSKLLDCTDYLFGSVFKRIDETDRYVKYTEENYIYKLDDEFNIIRQDFVSDRAWIDLVHYKDDRFIFTYQDDEYQYFQTLDKKTVSIPLRDNLTYTIFSEQLILFDSKHMENYQAYNNLLDSIKNPTVVCQEVLDQYREKERLTLLDKLSLVLPEYSVIYGNKTDTGYLVMAFESIGKYDIFLLDMDFEVRLHKELFNMNKTVFHALYSFNEWYYILFALNDTGYLIQKYDKEFHLLEEEKIQAYRCDIALICNQVCLIVDEPKRYDKELKKYRKQELMGNSSLFILS